MKRKYIFAILCFLIIKNVLEITQEVPLELILEEWIVLEEQAKRKQAYDVENGISTPTLSTELQQMLLTQRTPSILEINGGGIYTMNGVDAVKMKEMQARVGNYSNQQQAASSIGYGVMSVEQSRLLSYNGGVGSSMMGIETATTGVSSVGSIDMGANIGGLNEVGGGDVNAFSSSLSSAVGAVEAVAVNSPGGPGSGEGGESGAPPDDVIPIDGGLSVLLAAALGKGASTYRRRRTCKLKQVKCFMLKME